MSQTAMIILGFSVIFLATTAGSAIVWFFKRDISDKVNTLFLGFASGIMVAASVWSLIIPSIEGAESWGKWNFVPALIGFCWAVCSWYCLIMSYPTFIRVRTRKKVRAVP